MKLYVGLKYRPKLQPKLISRFHDVYRLFLGRIPVPRFPKPVDASSELHNASLRPLHQAQRLQGRLRIRPEEGGAAAEGLWRPGNGSNQRRWISVQVGPSSRP